MSKSYVVDHIKKLLRPFIAIWLLNVVLSILNHDGHIYDYLIELISLSFHYSDTLWFMKTIFCIYLLVFSVYAFIPNAYRLHVIAALVIFYILTSIYFFKNGWFWYNSLAAFPVGMICFQKNIHKKTFQFKHFNMVFTAFITTFLLYFFANRVVSNNTGVPQILMCISGTMFAILSVFAISFVSADYRLVRQIGNSTLFIYLIHVSLLAYLCKIENPVIFISLVILFTFILTTVFNKIEHKLCTKL